MSDDQEKLTPVLNQYKSVKKQYPDALLFFRIGDFYELYFEDARIASRELQLALTARNKNEANVVPMCGFPWHASQTYLAQLIDKGYSVAICEQISDPRASKGIVERAVTQVITPGTSLDEATLDAKTRNYLGAVFLGLHSCGFAWADISTGQWSGLEFKRQNDIWAWVAKLAPRELLIPDGQQVPSAILQGGARQVHQPAINFELKRAAERVMTAQEAREIGALGLEDKPALTRACGALIAYIEQTQINQPVRLLPFRPMDLGKRMIIDDLTERNLEIFVRLNGQKGAGTLRHVMDETLTPMGGRLMEDMLRHPWRDLKKILQIQEGVAYLMENDDLRDSLRSVLENLRDMERIITRIVLKKGSFRDLLALKQSAACLPKLKALLLAESQTSPGLRRAGALIDDLADCAELLESALEDPETENGVFKRGFHASLDEQIELMEHGEQKLRDLLLEEQQKTGISRLKLGYNRVFGYFFEASKAGLPKDLPDHFIRRQTLANGERFATESLKKLEEDLLQASDKRKELENELFLNLTEHIAAQKERVLQSADLIGQIDYQQSLAFVGRRDNWTMPELTEECEIRVKEGRHPVIENIIGSANFVPNDFQMDKSRNVCLITGPNMAGKSTILRQIAIIALMAQMGSPVPATSAVIGVVDRLFSRVGASDNIARGQSTFMVEMMETARILRQATKRSLVILDEIGRGTSTYDGMALAWAIIEDLADRCQGNLRTIFATHYHELTGLENRIPGLFNMNVAVGDYGSKEILFLHRLLPGPADRSYGVEVARLAGVPPQVVQRAREILKNLERTRARQTISNLILPGYEDSIAGVKNKIFAELQETNPETMTPERALELIGEWRESLLKARE